MRLISVNKQLLSEPLIFVYIPTYNRGDVLVERALSSVLKQSYKNIKVLVVGDGCTDNTEQLINQVNDDRVSFINLYPRVKRGYPDEPFYHWLSGPTIPSNHALSNVEGDYIARIDDDDIWTPDHLEKSLSFLLENNLEFVSSLKIETIDGKDKLGDAYHVLDPYYTKTPFKNDKKGPKIGSSSSLLYVSYLSFIKYNKSAWRKAWNKNNDIDFLLRVYKAGTRIGFLEEVLTYTSPRPGRSNTGSASISEKQPENLY